MPAYICLMNFTDQGIQNVKDVVEQTSHMDEMLGSGGARKIGVWYTLGQYDMVAIIEAPDIEAVPRLLLSAGMTGNIRTITMQAFSEDEMAKMVRNLS